MHKIGSLLFFTFFVLIEIKSQSIIGIWETIDDITGKAKSNVEIYEKSGKIFGKVIKLLPGAAVPTCNNCPGEKMESPLLAWIFYGSLNPIKIIGLMDR